MLLKLLMSFLLCVNLYASGTGVLGGATTSISGAASFDNTGGPYNVTVTDTGEMSVTSTEREKNVYSAFGVSGVAADEYFILVDKDDTTNFPHSSTQRIDISAIFIAVDRDSSATGFIKLGVIARIDGTNSDIYWFFGDSFEKSNDRHIQLFYSGQPSQLKTSIANNVPDKFITNDKSLNLAAVNTGVTLDSPRGDSTVTPAVGDIVMFLDHTAGTFDVNCGLFYHGES